MAPRTLVVIGASAGGVEALRQLAADLPAALPAAVCVVLHQPPRADSMLPQILTHNGPLPAALAGDEAILRHGRIYVAPPDAHLVVESNRLRLLRTARENNHRPAINPLFRSAARAYGAAVVGVLLSGAGDDGTEGLLMVKARGGAALVQDPADALFPRMPASAIAHIDVDAVLPAAALGRAIEQAVMPREIESGVGAVQSHLDPERDRAHFEQQIASWRQGEAAAAASGFTCPLCGGGIWMGTEGPLTRFQCHTGHEFSRDGFLKEQSLVLETTLWQALRSLRERETLLRRLSHQDGSTTATRFGEQADELERGIELLRQLLQGNGSPALSGDGSL